MPRHKNSIQCRPGISSVRSNWQLKNSLQFQQCLAHLSAIVRSLLYHAGFDYLPVISVLQNSDKQINFNLFVHFCWKHYATETQCITRINVMWQCDLTIAAADILLLLFLELFSNLTQKCFNFENVWDCELVKKLHGYTSLGTQEYKQHVHNVNYLSICTYAFI